MKIIKTSINRPPVIIIYGPHGRGKSSFAAQCPKPIFIDTEGGLGSLQVEAFEQSTSFTDVINAVIFLLTNDSPYKTLVLDSLDWTEKLIWEYVCQKNGVNDIASLPYGRGYALAELEWKRLIDYLTKLNQTKKMMIVCLAHDQITRFEDPERESYDRHTLDIHKRGNGLLCEWADIIGFISDKINTISKDSGFGASITKAKSTGERMLCLDERPAYVAKNRYDLPAQIPFPKGEAFKILSSYLWPAKPKVQDTNLLLVKTAHEEARKAGAYKIKDLNFSQALTDKQVEEIEKDLEILKNKEIKGK